MANGNLVLVATAGDVGGTVLEMLRARNIRARGLVHREGPHAEALRRLGVEVVVGDLTRPESVDAALEGVDRMLFAMPVSPEHLLAATVVAAVAKARGGLEALVGLSQMTVSQMTATSTSESN